MVSFFSFIICITIYGAIGVAIVAYLYWKHTSTIYSDSDYDKSKNHTAIIVIEYAKYHLISNLFLYCNGIHLLSQGLKELDEPFVYYPCKTKKDFLKILNTPEAKKIWILGHGMKHCLKFENEILYYCDCQNALEKDCIAQLHCNPFGGKSLADYLCKQPDESFISDDY